MQSIKWTSPKSFDVPDAANAIRSLLCVFCLRISHVFLPCKINCNHFSYSTIACVGIVSYEGSASTGCVCDDRWLFASAVGDTCSGVCAALETSFGGADGGGSGGRAVVCDSVVGASIASWLTFISSRYAWLCSSCSGQGDKLLLPVCVWIGCECGTGEDVVVGCAFLKRFKRPVRRGNVCGVSAVVPPCWFSGFCSGNSRFVAVASIAENRPVVWSGDRGVG